MTSALVLGCGSIGRRHANNLSRMDLDLYVFDVQTDAARAVAAEVGGRNFMNRDSAPDVDIVVVATPTVNHVADLEWALERGAHVFVEKPLGVSAADVGRARELSRRYSDHHVMIGCNMRFTDGYETIRRTLAELGPPITVLAEFGWYLPCWRPATDYRLTYSARGDLGGGIVLDAIHEIDYVVALAGEVAGVSARCATSGVLELDVEDTAEIVLSHRRGAVSHIHLDYLQPEYTRWCKVLAPGGTATWDYARGRVIVQAAPGDEPRTLLDGVDQDRNVMYQRELTWFLEVVSGRCEAVNDIDRAAAVLEVALEARRVGGVA